MRGGGREEGMICEREKWRRGRVEEKAWHDAKRPMMLLGSLGSVSFYF